MTLVDYRTKVTITLSLEILPYIETKETLDNN